MVDKLQVKLLADVAAASLPTGPALAAPVAAEELTSLPDSVQRYLHFMGVRAGQVRDWSFQLKFRGKFRIRQNLPWMNIEAWQYNTSLPISRIFTIRMPFFGLVPIFGHDSYCEGRGRMLIKLLDRFTLGDDTGPQMSQGELVTYLNDAIMFAPSMLLNSRTVWTSDNPGSFRVALTDHQNTVSALVYLDEKGAPKDFSTKDRFMKDYSLPDKPLVNILWTTPMQGFQEVHGRSLPIGGQAIWHTSKGDFAYADFSLVPQSVAFNLPPTSQTGLRNQVIFSQAQSGS